MYLIKTFFRHTSRYYTKWFCQQEIFYYAMVSKLVDATRLCSQYSIAIGKANLGEMESAIGRISD